MTLIGVLSSCVTRLVHNRLHPLELTEPGGHVTKLPASTPNSSRRAGAMAQGCAKLPSATPSIPP